MMKLLLLLLLALSSLTLGKETLKTQRMTGSAGFYTNQVLFGKGGKVHELEKTEDLFEVNQKYPELHLTNGDIVPSISTRNGITDTSIYWPNGIVPIQISTYFSYLTKGVIEDAREAYELRTCISIPDRTDEEDYLYLQPSSGCWSSVGVQGGGQTVSIGSGCEKTGTVIHEMMHAIGIYHEQSRTDRDDYISIESQNIDSGLLYNFDKYDYGFVDDRGVPYDYDSLMHYGDTAFTTNGQKTILAKDPKFQSRLGQRMGFSNGDVSLLNKMYSCSEPTRSSYTCNFNDDIVCGYAQDDNDDIDWIYYQVGETDGKSISSNIPDFDNTRGKSGEGEFMLLDTSNKVGGNKGNLLSMRLKSKFPKQCLEFSYYMDIDANSDAAIGVYLGTIDQSSGEILSKEPLVTLSGDHGSNWAIEQLTMQAPSYYRLIFEAKSGAYSDDVIALDDISILDRPCEAGYFMVNDFTDLLANTQPGEYFWSPLMYNDEGYAFKIRIYPQSTSSYYSDYVSMYIALAQGENDDQLQWPMSNRVIRMSVIDQDDDAVARRNFHMNFVTSTSSTYNRPTGEVGQSIGYTTFISHSEIFESRNFIKNDAVIFSLNTRNMNTNTYSQSHPQVLSQPEYNPHPKLIQSHHDKSEEEHAKDTNDVHVNVVVSQPHEDKHEDETTTSSSLIAGIAIACSLGVFVLMSLVMICMNQSHKQSLNALSWANHRLTDRSDNGRFTNCAYAEDKA